MIMGTRVDFYVGRGHTATWLGSYPFDGNPHGVFGDSPELFTEPLTETEWRTWVDRFLIAGGERSTWPNQGWPWPWEDSRLTDYSYAWDEDKIYGCCFAQDWFVVDPGDQHWGQPEDDDGPIVKNCLFPTMRDENSPKATLGPRSGLIVLWGK